MKNISLNLYSVLSVFFIILFILLAVSPFNLVDMEQAQRIAKWKSEYDELKYDFSLTDIYEGVITESIIGDEEGSNAIMIEKIKPYFRLEDEKYQEYKKYSYRQKNGRTMPKTSQFYFNKFVKCKDGTFISFKKNINYEDGHPLYYMFVDINGEQKPNRVGEDIFFISVYPHEIHALGYDKEYSKLKKNCSPIGNGLYCAEFYLL